MANQDTKYESNPTRQMTSYVHKV